MEKGTVYLVGAGPGDTGLLTMRGAELLSRADVIVYDALCNPSLLKLAPSAAEVIFGGKRAADHTIPQDQLNQLLVDKAGDGKTVVRLKGGDPFVFGRGGEEAVELSEAGVPFEIVPGISSAIAAPAYAGIPITHRDHCSSYTVITGHEQPSKGGESAVDWGQLSSDPGTKIILMGVDRIRSIADRLMENGLSRDTSVGMVRWGTTGRQETLIGQIDDIADLVDKNNFQSPAVTVIGSVVNLREKLNWFEKLPLFGQRVVVTRTRQQASVLTGQLTELGAEVLEMPTIRIEEPDDKITLKDGLLGLGSYQWLIFTSPNGVERFFDYFFKAFDDIRDIGGCRIAAIGPATAAKLKDLHLNIDLMPEDYTAAGVVKSFQESKDYTIENENVALFRAQVANSELPKALEKLGAIIDDIPVYKTVPETEDVTGAVSMMEEGGADWITFTSSSTVENFNARFGIVKSLEQHGMKPISIGPETSKTLRNLGVEPAIEASTHTIAGMVTALKELAGC
uniref:uroporphyrinogen-III C-methyltransferase n=1 Tax=uncultured verrucomicrobium HF0500_16O23 TaxID=723598 RepID=E7C586_9BACT|nr:uroporphyrinogen-III methylase [uncultured verrucomicrobium HF0500_16O23]